MTLSSTELTGMRTTVNVFLPDVAVVKRVTRSVDGMGGYTESWGTTATTVTRVDPPGNAPVLQLYAARLGERQMFILNFSYNTDVQEGDEVTVGSVVYEVLGVLITTWQIVKQVVCARQS